MKHLSLAIIFAALSAIVFTSCRKGAQGEPGPAGLSGKPLPYKAGSITATLEGTTRQNDSAFTLNLKYEYFKETNENTVLNFEGGYKQYIITRYDSTGNSYIKFEFDVYNDDEGANVIDEARITIVNNKQITANNNLYFASGSNTYYNPFNVSSVYLYDDQEGENSYIYYENLEINPTTGEISFDYSIDIDSNNNTTGNMTKLTGNIKATPFNVAYRQGSAE